MEMCRPVAVGPTRVGKLENLEKKMGEESCENEAEAWNEEHGRG